MTKDKITEESSSLTLLINIIQGSLIKREQDVLFFLTKHQEYLKLLEKERKIKDKDQTEIDRLSELLTFHEGRLIAYLQLLDLIVDLESNPYPGQQRRLMNTARSLYPAFQAYGRMRGKMSWDATFVDYKLPGEYRICFPQKVNNVDIEQVELMLLDLMREDNTILASEVPEALKLKVNGKPYREVKKTLMSRGWVWTSQRELGEKVKVVRPPTGTAL
jgi:hypothetical protein